jgi:Tol biopolymer transport system component
VWSPDGRYVYYVHLTTTSDASGFITNLMTMERLAYPDGSSEVLAHDVYWPRLSPDGLRLVYVTSDPTSYSSKLFVANADGTDPKQIALPENMLVDAPLFSPDGQWIIYSGIDFGTPAPLSWMDQLLGVRVASAHNIPSDWWRVPVAGGQPEQLTQLYDSGLYGDFSPDGQYFVFTSLSGLFVMPAPVQPELPEDSGLTLIVSGTDAYGTVAWVP